jgi:hypothetical protein
MSSSKRSHPKSQCCCTCLIFSWKTGKCPVKENHTPFTCTLSHNVKTWHTVTKNAFSCKLLAISSWEGVRCPFTYGSLSWTLSYFPSLSTFCTNKLPSQSGHFLLMVAEQYGCVWKPLLSHVFGQWRHVLCMTNHVSFIHMCVYSCVLQL